MVGQEASKVFVDDRAMNVQGKRGSNTYEELLHPGAHLDANPPKLLATGWKTEAGLRALQDAHRFVHTQWAGHHYAQFFFMSASLGFIMPQYDESPPFVLAVGKSHRGKSIAAYTALACLFPFLGKFEHSKYQHPLFIKSTQFPMARFEALVNEFCSDGGMIVLDDWDKVDRQCLYATLQDMSRGGRGDRCLIIGLVNPKKEGALPPPEVERTCLRITNYGGPKLDDLDPDTFKAGYTQLLNRMCLVAPVLPIIFENAADAPEWNMFKEHLNKTGVTDRSRRRMYTLTTSHMYRHWLRFGFCLAEALGTLLGESKEDRRKHVTKLFGELIGHSMEDNDPSPVPCPPQNTCLGPVTIHSVSLDQRNEQGNYDCPGRSCLLVLGEDKKYYVADDLKKQMGGVLAEDISKLIKNSNGPLKHLDRPKLEKKNAAEVCDMLAITARDLVLLDADSPLWNAYFQPCIHFGHAQEGGSGNDNSLAPSPK